MPLIIPADESPDEGSGAETNIRAEIAKAINASKQSSDADRLKWSERHFLVFRIRYPRTSQHDASEGYLIYMKSTLTGDEPLEVRPFKKYEPQFPHNPTSDPFYDPVRFDAPVELGYHIASQLGPKKESPEQLCPAEFIDWITSDAKPVARKPTVKRKKS